MKKIAILAAACALAFSLSAQDRFPQRADDGTRWTKVEFFQDTYGVEIAMRAKTGVENAAGYCIVPPLYCHAEYRDGYFVMDSCESGNISYEALYTSLGTMVIPAARHYETIRVIRTSRGDIFEVSTYIDGKAYWGICDKWGKEVVHPRQYESLMYNPHSDIVYSDGAFFVQGRRGPVRLPVYVDTRDRFYGLDERENRVYLSDSHTESPQLLAAIAAYPPSATMDSLTLEQQLFLANNGNVYAMENYCRTLLHGYQTLGEDDWQITDALARKVHVLLREGSMYGNANCQFMLACLYSGMRCLGAQDNDPSYSFYDPAKAKSYLQQYLDNPYKTNPPFGLDSFIISQLIQMMQTM